MTGRPKILLSFDVELWTWRGDFRQDIDEPLSLLADWLTEIQVPATLFVSLSNKGLGADDPKVYLNKMLAACDRVSGHPFIEIGIHPHCRNLPLSFPTPHDELDHYNAQEVDEIIRWNAETLGGHLSREITLHRAARYRLPAGDPASFADLLAGRGLRVDSSDISIPYSRPTQIGPLLEVPPASNPDLAPRLIVWSPEKMDLFELLDFVEAAPANTECLVMNFHSFSLTHSPISAESMPIRVWSSLPPAAQSIMRPALGLFKKGWRAAGRDHGLAQAGPQAGQNFERLKMFVAQLKAEGYEFSSFNTIHQSEARKAV